MMKSLKTIAVAALIAAPVSVSAATYSVPIAGGGSYSAEVVAKGPDAWAAVDISKSVDLPTGATWTNAPFILPSADLPIDFGPDGDLDPCRNACSPFYGGVIGTPANIGAPGWETTPFFTFFDGLDGFDPSGAAIAPAILSFDAPQNSLSLLWGSPDVVNVISFFLSGSVVATFLGELFNGFDPDIIGGPGRGAVFATFSGLTFDGVQFATGPKGGSFEFANVTATPVPLPPAILALMAAFGGLLVVSRRRKQVSAEA